MKIHLSIFAVLLCVLLLASCGVNGEIEPTSVPSMRPTVEPTTAPTTEPATTPATESATESATTPATEPVTEPTTELTTEPTTALVTEPTALPTELPTEHVHIYIDTVVSPTCTEEGYTIHTCACGDRNTDTVMAANGHEYATTEVAATCQAEGYTTYTCSVCGNGYTDNYTEKIAHTYTDKVIDPTCTAEGYTIYTCSVCGDVYEDAYTEKAAHAYTDKAVPATCSAEGYTVHTCSVCGDGYTDNYTEKSAHAYTDKVIAPTCAAEGYTIYTCSVCGDSYTDAYTEQLAHHYADTVVEPTCATPGYTAHTCTICGDSYKDNQTTAEHSWSDWHAPENPYENTHGSYERTCMVCGMKEPYYDHTHTYEETSITEATCSSTGSIQYHCSDCGLGKKETISRLPHNYVETVVAPTCTKTGYTKHVCADCGDDFKDTEVPATGHLETYVEDNTWGPCGGGSIDTRCSECHTILSSIDVPWEDCSYTETKRLSDAALFCWQEYNEGYYAKYIGYEDWLVDTCPKCGYPDPYLETRRFAYTDYEAAYIMLGYVNELRESIFGTDKYNLVLNETLMEYAQIRAKELSENFSHGGTFTNAAENIVLGPVNIYDQFIAWYNSPGHYSNMTDKYDHYFAYGFYCDEDGVCYGVQLFWDEVSRID